MLPIFLRYLLDFIISNLKSNYVLQVDLLAIQALGILDNLYKT